MTSLDLYQPGVKCWIPNEQAGWLGAVIISRRLLGDDTRLELVLEDEQRHQRTTIIADLPPEQASDQPSSGMLSLKSADTAPGSQRLSVVGAALEKLLPPLRNPPMLEAIDDLTHLSYLHEPDVLNTIRIRYSQRTIYTYSGIVLIAINPFAHVPLYTLDVAQAYSGKRRGELEPHLFAVAEDAYRYGSLLLVLNLTHSRVTSHHGPVDVWCVNLPTSPSLYRASQALEAKTVSAKFIMRYFAAVGSFDREDGATAMVGGSAAEGVSADGWEKGISYVESQVLATNPIMEAFGNAKTTRNDNSSRFGKFIEIQFNSRIEIVGARIRTYLLERSRVVFQPDVERNYHIFYQLCAGAPHAERKELSLSPCESFHYLRQGGQPTIPNVDDAADFEVTTRSLSTIGIPVSRQWKVFTILAAILHLGNCVIKSVNDQSFIPDDDESFQNFCRLIGVEIAEFRKWILKKQIVMRTEKIVSNLNVAQASNIRDSVAKYIYCTLFDWLVRCVNGSLANEDASQVKQFIGVLDIYGFEHFKRNSFEQFCINYANEKLQQEFNQHVFKLEQEEYVKEKINWSFIDFNDNQPCIELIEGRLGILDLLDEESRLPSGTDASFINKLYKQFATPPSKHAYFGKPRFSQTAFIVIHYAHSVVYEAEGFLEKNKDTVPEELLFLLQDAKFDFCGELFPKSIDSSADVDSAAKYGSMSSKYGSAKRGSLQKPTLGSSFKNSLHSLMGTIRSTNVHYIRCIKPNEQRQAFVFEPLYVVSQLRACGVLETIRISCAGYPSRFGFHEFADRYKILLHSSKRVGEVRDLCLAILGFCISDPDKYQVGLTKIFLRAGQVAYIEKKRHDRLVAACVLMQKQVRRLHCRRRFLLWRKSALKLQSVYRGYVARRACRTIRRTRACIILQTHWRRHQAQIKFRKCQRAILAIQCAYRQYAARMCLLGLRFNHAAIKIQARFRAHVERQRYLRDLHSIVVAQSAIRRHFSRVQLKKLRIEARSVHHFQAKAGALEKKLFELTQALADREHDAKSFKEKIASLEHQIVVWKEKFERSEEKRTDLDRKFREMSDSNEKLVSDLKSMIQSIQLEKTSLLEAGNAKDKQLTSLSEEIKSLQEQVGEARASSAVSQKKEEADRIAQLVAENSLLKEKIAKTIGGRSRVLTQGPSHQSIPLDGRTTPAVDQARRLTSGSIQSAVVFADAPVSDISPLAAPVREDSLFSAPGVISESSSKVENLNEVAKLLHDPSLDRELTDHVVLHLVIPPTLPPNVRNKREVHFPAHLIGVVVVQCWRFGFSDRVKLILLTAVKNIHETMKYEDNLHTAFWLSNIYELICILRTAQNDREAVSAHRRDSTSSDTGHVVVKHRTDLEYLMIEIYYNWLKELKRHLGKLVVPAVIEYQGLPGFVDDASNNVGFFNRWMAANPAPTPVVPIEKLLAFLTKLQESMSSYYMEDTIKRQLMATLIRNIGAVAFNQLLMRKNFCTWRRGMQIQYNVTRIEEWCAKNDITEASLHLEPLMQAAKLLQLNKTSMEDAEIMFDVCFLLTPIQIKKILSMYHTAEFEAPIPAAILQAVSARCLDENDSIMYMDANDDSAFVAPPAVLVHALDRFIPLYLEKKVSTLKHVIAL